jgi:DNA-binding NarL/FixJ family response regulator
LVVAPPEVWPASQALEVSGGELPEPLTTREHEVLQLLAEGLSNKLVARRLRISEHTVKFHVSSIYAKLGATNRTEAVSHAARRGLVTL